MLSVFSICRSNTLCIGISRICSCWIRILLFGFLYGATDCKLSFCNLLTVVRHVLKILVLVFTAKSCYMIIAELNENVNSTVVSKDASQPLATVSIFCFAVLGNIVFANCDLSLCVGILDVEITILCKYNLQIITHF